MIKGIGYIVICLTLLSCKKIHKGNYIIEMTESNGFKNSFKSEVAKSTFKHIQFIGDEFSGILNKSGKNVEGGLTIGNTFPIGYTFTINVHGKITDKNVIQGSYVSDIRAGTFTIKPF